MLVIIYTFQRFLHQVKCVDGSADEIMKKAAAHKINLRKLDSGHVSVVLIQKNYCALLEWKSYTCRNRSLGQLRNIGVFLLQGTNQVTPIQHTQHPKYTLLTLRFVS